MRKPWVMVMAVIAVLTASNTVEARPYHRLHVYRYGSLGFSRVRHGVFFVDFARYGTAGRVGAPISRYAARFMGYPYNVPGYRYEYADACFLRVGGLFGPGPSIGPCPFGLDRPF